jgi:hypothetical protein
MINQIRNFLNPAISSFGKLTKGGVVRVTRDGDKLGFSFTEAPPRAAAPKEPELVEP